MYSKRLKGNKMVGVCALCIWKLLQHPASSSVVPPPQFIYYSLCFVADSTLKLGMDFFVLCQLRGFFFLSFFQSAVGVPEFSVNDSKSIGTQGKKSKSSRYSSKYAVFIRMNGEEYKLECSVPLHLKNIDFTKGRDVEVFSRESKINKD